VKLAVLCAALAGCSFSPGRLATTDGASPIDAIDTMLDPDVAPPGVWLTGFGYRKQITITPGATGTLTDFPVGIARATDADLAAHARSDGRDLVVTAADASSILTYELAYWDAGTGGFELWVRVPSLPLATPTTVFLYYGGPPTVGSPAATWSSSVFAGVWHLSESGTTVNDSTSTANQLGVLGTDTSPSTASGITGVARGPTLSTDRLSVVDNDTLDFASVSFSFSTWVHQTATNDQYDMPIYKGGTNSCCAGWGLLLGSGSWDVKIHDGGGTNANGTDWESVGFGDESTFRNRWVHLVGVVDRTANQLRAYADGAFTGMQSITGIGALTSSQNFAIGKGSGGQWFNGLIDETRVYNTALTAEWIATEHANLTSSTFVTVGAETTP